MLPNPTSTTSSAPHEAHPESTEARADAPPPRKPPGPPALPALVERWNATDAPYPAATIHALFEAQAAATPDATALTFEGTALSYRELDARANQLAHHLRRLGVGLETLVGVCLERSIEMVVALLGVLKSGGAYVPLDPSYPTKRLALMIDDALAPVLLTEARIVASLPEPSISGASGTRVVCLDADRDALAHEPTHAPPRAGSPDHLAYVIYTSGSTGRPKGVLGTHRAAVNRFAWMWSAYPFEANEVCCQKTKLSFVDAIWETFGPLLRGVPTVLLPDAAVSDVFRFVRALADARVTRLVLVPSLLRAMLDLYPDLAARLPSLQHWTSSGEALPKDLVARFVQTLPGRTLLNLYGSSEVMADATCAEVTRAPANGGVSIGRPIANTQVYVLDAEGDPVPVGTPGELHVGGLGVARGYLNRPELTADRFLPDRFRDPSGAARARLYRTGDLGRWRHDGQLEYLGRVDHQVKIRGVRVELGEIEGVLAQHGSVRASVVVARDDGGPDDKRIVAYVVPRAGNDEREASETTEAGERVAHWGALWDETYKQTTTSDATFDIVGWNASDTGAPIPADEMRQWVDHTVARILALRARRVLEIGSGTGLLRFRIAPHAERYLGTDISATALQSQRSVAPDDDRVTLSERAADDFRGIAPRSFDAVIINSVVQYFPNVDYLLRVLDGAVEAVEDGGHVFLGDLRSLPLLEALHTSTELHRAADTLPVAELRKRIARRVAEDEELVLDPDLFTALRRRLPRIGRVEVQLKRGRYQNEVSRFRYDVTLHVGPRPATASERVVEWGSRGRATSEIARLLDDPPGTPAPVRVRRVPSARIERALAAVHLLADGDASSTLSTAGELRARIDARPRAGAEPEDFWSIGEGRGLDVEIAWSRGDVASDAFDVVFRARDTASAWSVPLASPARDGEDPAFARPWSAYANDPLLGAIDRDLVPRLRDHLKATLPEVMVPSAFVVLRALPLLPNGKVDRGALPAPDGERLDRSRRFVAPRTPVEEVLAVLWAEVLRLERVSILDNFFELGGHSLMAMQTLGRLRAVLGVELALQALFDAPTVAGLALAVEAAMRRGVVHAAPPLAPLPRPRELPLSLTQRLWFIDGEEPSSALHNILVATRLRGPLSIPAIERSLEEIRRRHEALRTTFPRRDGRAYQAIETSGAWHLHVVDVAEEEVLPRARLEAAEPFDVTRGPLFRATLLRVSPTVHVLLLTVHHLVSDGWSRRVLLEELQALYEAFASDRPSPLAPLAVQYGDFTLWQHGWLTDDVVDDELRYWRRRLASAPPPLRLPTDRPRPSSPSYRGAVVPLALPAELTASLRSLARREGVTSFMLLLAALQLVLGEVTGEKDFVVVSPIAGRTQIETEQLVGVFINLLALRADLSGDPTVRELLERVRGVTLEAYAHQKAPFESVVKAAWPDVDLHRCWPLRAMLAFEPAPPALPMGELQVEVIDVPPVMVEYELTLAIEESEQGLRGALQYNADLFDQATIARWAERYEARIAAMCTEPDRRVSSL